MSAAFIEVLQELWVFTLGFLWPQTKRVTVGRGIQGLERRRPAAPKEQPAGVFLQEAKQTPPPLPEFHSGEIYTAKHSETKRLRALTADISQRGSFLGSHEYAWHMLQQHTHQQRWPALGEPGITGSWQVALRGQRGVRVGIEPKTGAVLECAGSGLRPFLGYVQAVRPDASLTVASVGRVTDGQYLVEDFLYEVWREWRPVFISFL